MITRRPLTCVVLALLLVAAAHAIMAHEQVAEKLRIHVFESDRHLARGELLLSSIVLLLGLPAAMLLSGALSSRAGERLAVRIEKLGLWAPAVFATAVSFLLTQFVTQHAWYTDDEQGYIFQMLTYREFHLTVPALQPEHLFYHPFVVVARIDAMGSHWSGIYPVVQPALMALSSFLGSPFLSQWLCVGLISYHAGALTTTLTRRRGYGILAAWLVATSPMLIGLSSTYHSAVPSTLLSVLAVRVLLVARDSGRWSHGALLGLLAGATFLTRSLEGTLIVVASGAVLAWTLRHRPRNTWRALLGFCAAGAPALLVYFAVNHGITGDMWTSAYHVWELHAGRVLGFGHGDMMWHRTHTPLHGLSQTFTAIARMNVWMFGWPVVFVVLLLVFVRPLRDRRVLWLLALSAAQLSMYFFLPFGSVHDHGSAYHVWHVPWVAAVIMLIVERGRPLFQGVGRLLAAMTCVGLLIFWPVAVNHWRWSASITLASSRAAEEATAGKDAIVLWKSAKPAGTHTWVHVPPASFPDNPMWWARDLPGAEEILRRMHPNRVLYRLVWEGEEAKVSPIPAEDEPDEPGSFISALSSISPAVPGNGRAGFPLVSAPSVSRPADR